jgi:diguanylate cyclase (GGDEF)-like protein
MDISTESKTLKQRVIDLPVSKKLFIGFAWLTGVLVLVLGCLFLTVDRLGQANNRIVAGTAVRSDAADHLRFAAAELRAAQQSYVMSWPTGHSQFDEATGQFEASLQNLREAGGDPVQSALVEKIATGYQTFLATDQLIWQALQAGDATLAKNLTLGPENLAFSFMAHDATAYAEFADEAQADAVTNFAQTSADAQALGVILGFIALAVMLTASWVITRLIRDPLHRVQLAAERAAEGDLEAEADVTGDDETGRLAQAFNSMLRKLRLREETLLAEHSRQETSTRVHRAFEMADDEAASLEVIGITMAAMLPGRSAELLLADNSKSNLEQAVVAGTNSDGPGCPVASPFSCVAVRSGAAVTFESSNALDACPHLRHRGATACSAVCVPVTFMGRAIGVIHAVAEEGEVPSASEIEALSMLSTQAGARIGMLRTMVRTGEQASTDSLTGLMNRRTFQTRVRALRRSNIPFTLVMADIDRFKQVNDTYGHETGDRAIKTFCEVAKSALRHTDLIGRWGGEEFAFAFTDLDPEQAQATIDRIRLELSVRLSTSDLPGFTASFGIVDAAGCASLEDAVRLADGALYAAKGAGRNQSVIAALDATDIAASKLPAGVRVIDKQRSVRSGVLATLASDDDPLDR